MHFDSDVKFNIVARCVLESELPYRSKVIYSILCGFADSEGKAYPSRSTISKRAKCSIKSVDRSIKELENLGALKVIRRKKPDGNNEVNIYTLIRANPVPSDNIDATPNVPAVPSLPPDKSPKENHIKKTNRRRDLIFEELANQCGIDWKKAPKNELGRLQKATKQMKEIEATPEEIKSVGEWYKSNWKDIEITPTAIVNNFSSILRRVEESKIQNKKHDCEIDGHNFIDLDVIYFCQYCKEEKVKVET